MIELREASSATDYNNGVVLFKEYASELTNSLEFQNFHYELKNIKSEYSRPEGSLIIAYDCNNKPIGCSGIRKIDQETCELKRMYIKKSARGDGLGKRLLLESIRLGRSLNYKRMRLDTWPTMHRAIKLYQSVGFYEIAPYRYNPIEGTKYMELNL